MKFKRILSAMRKIFIEFLCSKSYQMRNLEINLLPLGSKGQLLWSISRSPKRYQNFLQIQIFCAESENNNRGIQKSIACEIDFCLCFWKLIALEIRSLIAVRNVGFGLTLVEQLNGFGAESRWGNCFVESQFIRFRSLFWLPRNLTI